MSVSPVRGVSTGCRGAGLLALGRGVWDVPSFKGWKRVEGWAWTRDAVSAGS